jgi:hypothetical protein
VPDVSSRPDLAAKPGTPIGTFRNRKGATLRALLEDSEQTACFRTGKALGGGS